MTPRQTVQTLGCQCTEDMNIVFLLMAIWLLSIQVVPQTSGKPLNVLFFLADDLGKCGCQRQNLVFKKSCWTISY